MKVGVTVRQFGPYGGMERVALGFVRWLVSEGHTVDVWSSTFTEIGPSVRHRPLGAGGRGVMWKAKSLAAAVAAVPVDECDVFLHFERGARGGAYRAGAGCAAAQAQQEGGGLAWSLLTSIDRRSCRSAAPLIVNSEMVRAQMEEHYGIASERMHLVRNGVDTARFQPGLKAEEPTLVFVGDNPRRKGLQTALKVLLRLPNARLDVVGDVGRRGRRWADQLGVSSRVRFHGRVERPEAVVSMAHAMILPTRYDASANACLEALACGVPVVTTRFNGVCELLPEPWLVVDEPTDADRCAEVLTVAMADNSLRDACRRVAEAHTRTHGYASLLAAISGDEA